MTQPRALTPKPRHAAPRLSRFAEGAYVNVRAEDLPAGVSVKLSRAEAARLGLIARRAQGKSTAPAPAEAAFAPDFRAKALLKGVQIAQDDLRRAGGAYTLEEVQTLLHGVSRQSIEARVRKGGLLAVPGPSNRRYYPVAQFRDDGAVVDGLADVQATLPTRNGFAILNFLINPDDRLGGRKPIDLLRDGEVERVVEAARRYGEAGA